MKTLNLTVMDKLKKGKHEIDKTNVGISKTLLDELAQPTFDLSVDYSEIFIDDFINNEAIKEIPIIKSAVGLVKGGISISQFWFAKKILLFIKAFNDGSISQEKLDQFKHRINCEKNFGKKVAERLMVYIDRNIEIRQTIIISNLFRAYVNEKLSYEQFNNIAITLDNLNPKSFDAFFELEKYDFHISSENHKKFGPRDFESETYILNSGFATEPSDWFSGLKLNDDGLNLFQYGIKPLKNTGNTTS